jgi:hypothetical protein
MKSTHGQAFALFLSVPICIPYQAYLRDDIIYLHTSDSGG